MKYNRAAEGMTLPWDFMIRQPNREWEGYIAYDK
jgi:hypothetical protein